MFLSLSLLSSLYILFVEREKIKRVNIINRRFTENLKLVNNYHQVAKFHNLFNLLAVKHQIFKKKQTNKLSGCFTIILLKMNRFSIKLLQSLYKVIFLQ